jgi:GT2 family glycosyltransferase
MIAFPGADGAVADIVIIAWTRVDTLRACLQSLADMEAAPTFGVRIAANGATEEVRRFLRDEVSGATVVEIAENIGFGGGCNAAAAGSRAENLVFLNDDAVVATDWLSALVDAAARTGATAVSALMLNPDGTVQEAGSRVRADAGTVQFGAGLSVEEAAQRGLLTERRVDYGSGASLLVRRDAFESVGGFDEAYRPAYFEDVDLCFRLASAGMTVFFTPAARATHASGGSTAASLRFRDFASDNAGALFTSRWAATLATAPSPDEPIDRLCRVEAPDYAAVPVRAHEEDATAAALEIQRGYAAWLERSLDSAQSESQGLRAELERQRAAADAAKATADETAKLLEVERLRAESLGDRAHDLDRQISSLIDANPVNLLRWHSRARRTRAQ